MGETSTGLTWPVRTHAWPAYYKRDVDQGHHGMTMQHNQSYTAQPERKLNCLSNGRRKCVTEGGGLWKIKMHHPHCHSELLLITRDCLPL